MFFSSYKISELITVGLLSGCMSQQIVNTKHMDAAALKQASSSTHTPQQICETASLAVAKANKEELNFLCAITSGTGI